MSDFQYVTTKHDSGQRLWITLQTHDTMSPQTVLLLNELSTVLHAVAQNTTLQGIIITTATEETNTPQTAMPPTQPATSLQALAATLELTQTAGQQLNALNIPSVVILKHPISMHTISLAVAATYCISSDDQQARLAFMETKHGLHPNMLSTQQAIRRMGAATAMKYLLSGETLSPELAVQTGLLDTCVAETELYTAATDLLVNKPSSKQAKFTQHLRTLWPFRKTLNFDLHDNIRNIGKQSDYPAPYALLGLWERYGLDSTADTQQAYTDSVQHLSQTQQAENLSRITRLSKHLCHTASAQAENTIKHIYLIGFGAEACNIATYLLPYNVYVTLHSRQSDTAEQTLPLIKQALNTGHNTSASQVQNMLRKLSHDVKGETIGDMDLIIVADSLNLANSQELFAELEEKARPDTILAVHPNTLTLDSIAAALLNPRRLIGMHFNQLPVPADTTQLVEIAFSEKTDKHLLDKVQLFLRQMGHMTLTMPSSPGQLVKRILLHYILQGIRLHQQGVPHAYIDRAGQNCGMPEGPLELADKLGLDYCQHLAEALQKTQHAINIPYSLDDKVRAGQLGIKSGSGFYRYRNGNRLKTERTQWNGSEQALQEKLVGQICEEAAICLEEGLLDNPDLIDAGIIFGVGFAPYPGGPLYQQRQHAVNNS